MYMRRSINIILNTAICIFAAIISVSCLTEKEGPSAGRQNVMIELSVKAADMTKATEAPLSSEAVINSLHVYAFYQGKLAGYAHKASGMESFYMDLELPESGVHDVEFYLVANEDAMTYQNNAVTLSRTTTKAELKALKFNVNASASAIPMYCVQTEALDVDALRELANTEEGHEGHFVLAQTLTFKMNRSLAKIEVYAARESGASTVPQILGVSMLPGGTREYSFLFEQEASVLNAVPSMTGGRVIVPAAVSITDEVVKNSADALDPDNYTEVTSSPFYLPEVTYGSEAWNVLPESDRAVVLHVQYTLGEGYELKNAYIYMPPVVRNTIYKVCIFISAEGQIIINYVVADWTDGQMWENGLDFNYPTHSFLRNKVPATAEDMASKPANPAVMSETEPFTGYFQMSAPEEEYWTPTLMGLEASDCILRVYGPDGLETYDRPIKADPEGWYTIKVYPAAGKVDVGDEVRLAITYKPIWSDVSEFLMINGTEGNFYWPYSGTGDEDADYVIITMVN